MNNIANIGQIQTWQNFKGLLENNSALNLRFRYTGDKFVNDAYHITEIKQAVITSVDCGGKKNEWVEVIVQLWEPDVTDAGARMTAEKALSIIAVVERELLIEKSAIVKIEFGNPEFDTRQMLPSGFSGNGNNLVIELVADATQCKALGRGDTCGPKSVQKTVCAPNSGCC